jgi:hypothetical protein
MAFKQALATEGDVPARYIALAKTEEKLGKKKEAIQALESAYDLDGSVATLRQILAIYESMGDTEAMTSTMARIETKIAEDNAAAEKKAAAKKTSSRSARRFGAGNRGQNSRRPSITMPVSPRRQTPITFRRTSTKQKKIIQ